MTECGDDPAMVFSQMLASMNDDFADEAAAPIHWPSLSPALAADAWPELYEWVIVLQQRFREMVRLPVCWYRHNGLVEALAALRDHERASYGANAAPTAAVAWHAAFRDIEARLRVWIADLRCGGDPDYHDPAVHAAGAPTADLPPEFTAWVEQDRDARERRAADAG